MTTNNEQRGASSETRVVSSVRVHPRRPERYRVEVDGKSVAVVDADIVLALGLRKGLAFTPELEAQLEAGAARLETLDRALNALSSRARSRRELERWLVQKALPPEYIPGALDALEARGFLDDAAFARGFVRDRAVNRRQSRRRIAAELGRRGVHRTLADRAIAEVFAEHEIDESAQAREAALRKVRALAKLEPHVAKRRLYGFLARKGFGGEAIKAGLEELQR
jgi:regulatory protein